MKKFILITIPILVIALFILVMNSDFLFEEPDNYDVPAHMEMMKKSILQDDWTSLGFEVEQMDKKFTKEIFPYIQFSAEKDEINDLDLNLSRLRACLDTKDKSLALVYVEEMKNHWENLNR